jgi:hypothetical protein
MTRLESYLVSREAEKQRQRKEALRKIAPGFEPQATLIPVKKSASASQPESGHRDIMDEVVDQLAALSYGSR